MPLKWHRLSSEAHRTRRGQNRKQMHLPEILLDHRQEATHHSQVLHRPETYLTLEVGIQLQIAVQQIVTVFHPGMPMEATRKQHP